MISSARDWGWGPVQRPELQPGGAAVLPHRGDRVRVVLRRESRGSPNAPGEYGADGLYAVGEIVYPALRVLYLLIAGSTDR